MVFSGVMYYMSMTTILLTTTTPRPDWIPGTTCSPHRTTVATTNKSNLTMVSNRKKTVEVMRLNDQMTNGKEGNKQCLPDMGKDCLLGCVEAPDKSTTAGGASAQASPC